MAHVAFLLDNTVLVLSYDEYYSFIIHLFNKCVLYTYYVPHTDKINKMWFLQGLFSIMARQVIELFFFFFKQQIFIECLWEPGTILNAAVLKQDKITLSLPLLFQ